MRLGESGGRYTRQRRHLVEILERAGMPLAIPDILRGRRNLAQSSVYRNLAALERAGVVRRVPADEGFGRYELTEDLTEHHHHLICSSCGRVQDVEVPEDLEREVDRTLDRLARRAGFASVAHRLDLIGRCGRCATRGTAARA
ncbi:MAG: transcriptional repressor [Actinobacteria bacterium]|nr:transcriptional repressor [Actinomycetota bacterium]